MCVHVSAKCHVVASGKILGISMGFDPVRVAEWRGRGVSLMSLSMDIEIMIAGVRKMRGVVDEQNAPGASARAKKAKR